MLTLQEKRFFKYSIMLVNLLAKKNKKQQSLKLRAQKKAQKKAQTSAFTQFRKLFKQPVIRQRKPIAAKVRPAKSIEYESTQCSTQDSDSEEEEPAKSLQYEST